MLGNSVHSFALKCGFLVHCISHCEDLSRRLGSKISDWRKAVIGAIMYTTISRDQVQVCRGLLVPLCVLASCCVLFSSGYLLDSVICHLLGVLDLTLVTGYCRIHYDT